MPRAITRPASVLLLIAWAGTMGLLLKQTYFTASASNLATDLARYGSGAQWRGVYYRGEKIGFTVSQTIARDDGFELHEDGRLQMSLLGATTPATLHTTAHVDHAFALRRFSFSLDPGTGPVEVQGTVEGLELRLTITSAGSTRTDTHRLTEPPVLAQNLARRLAGEGIKTGVTRSWMLFDPATMRNAPVQLTVGRREVVEAGFTRVPAFRVDMDFVGLRTTAWVTDTGEVVREESPLGLISVRESQQAATRMAVPFSVQRDLLESSAVVPQMTQRIDEPRDVRRLRLRIDGADLSAADLQGVGQTVAGNIVELRDPRSLQPGPLDRGLARYLAPEPFIESDDPEIVREAERAVAGARRDRERAERLARYVNALLDKKPTVSLPSAREVLRTKVGDCNEHTALYVAMARAIGLPARIAVGLTFVRGAFYYHAWPEVYLTEADGGLWLPVDPTLNQFPADATHLRLARGGLDRQSAILPLIGRVKMTVLDLELAPGSTPLIVGQRATDMSPLSIPLPARSAGGCWSAAPTPARRR